MSLSTLSVVFFLSFLLAAPFFVLKSSYAIRNKPVLVNEALVDNLSQSAKGFFKKLRFVEHPFNGSALSFQTIDGHIARLEDFKGKTVLLSLWASWCVPCRKELPELAALQRELAGQDFEVIAVNMGTKTHTHLEDFMEKAKAKNLVLYRDPAAEIFDKVKKHGLAIGLPVTLLFDKNMDLIASYNGIAPWNSEDAKDLIRKAMQLQKRNP